MDDLRPVPGPPKASPALEVPAPALLGAPVRPVGRLAGKRVLVVEDEADAREIISTLLEMAGASVRSVASVAEAMDSVSQSFDPDVVLTDFSMPDANGLDLIREFRKAPSARAAAVPIVVVSGHSGVRWRERALEAGAADLLAKPFEPAVLVARIAAAIAPGRSGPH